MSKRYTVFALTLMLPLLASAKPTFANLAGVYQIKSCDNAGAKSQDNICEFDTMVVKPSDYSTAIYFYKSDDGAGQYRSLGYPRTEDLSANDSYKEEGTTSASYLTLGRDYREVTSLYQNADGTFHLSLYRSSIAFKTNDLFELTLAKVSNSTPEIPSLPGGGDDE